jgi:hypothetical protein
VRIALGARTKEIVSALGVAAALAAGCGNDVDRPPLGQTCRPGDVCKPGSSVGSPDYNGQGGEGSGEGEGGAPGELTGSVREFVDELFTSTIPFDGRATIAAEGERRAVVETTYTGSGEFALEGFDVADPLWLGVFPEENRGVLPTLAPVALDSIGGESLDLGVVREDNVDRVFQLQATPSERLPGTGQLFLLFTKNGRGVPGIEVSLPEAEFVSYANGGAWSAADSRTDASGLVALTNILASAFPGSTKRVYLGGALDGYLLARVAAGSVSVVEVPIE